MDEIWTLCFHKWNGGNADWFPSDPIVLTEWPQVGDLIEVEQDQYRVEWVNVGKRNIGVRIHKVGST